MRPGEVIAVMKEEGFDDPFEIHVVDRSMLELCGRRSKLIRL